MLRNPTPNELKQRDSHPLGEVTVSLFAFYSVELPHYSCHPIFFFRRGISQRSVPPNKTRNTMLGIEEPFTT